MQKDQHSDEDVWATFKLYLCLGGLDGTGVLEFLSLSVASKELGAEIEDWEWAWNTGGGTCGNDGEVPAHDSSHEAEATSDLVVVFALGNHGWVAVGVAESVVTCGEQSEEWHQAPNSDRERDVGSEGAKSEDE